MGAGTWRRAFRNLSAVGVQCGTSGGALVFIDSIEMCGNVIINKDFLKIIYRQYKDFMYNKSMRTFLQIKSYRRIE